MNALINLLPGLPAVCLGSALLPGLAVKRPP